VSDKKKAATTLGLIAGRGFKLDFAVDIGSWGASGL
jgi:hypothetical protein